MIGRGLRGAETFGTQVRNPRPLERITGRPLPVSVPAPCRSGDDTETQGLGVRADLAIQRKHARRADLERMTHGRREVNGIERPERLAREGLPRAEKDLVVDPVDASTRVRLAGCHGPSISYPAPTGSSPRRQGHPDGTTQELRQGDNLPPGLQLRLTVCLLLERDLRPDHGLLPSHPVITPATGAPGVTGRTVRLTASPGRAPGAGGGVGGRHLLVDAIRSAGPGSVRSRSPSPGEPPGDCRGGTLIRSDRADVAHRSRRSGTTNGNSSARIGSCPRRWLDGLGVFVRD